VIKRDRQPSLLHDIVLKSPNLAPGSREKYARDLDAWIAFASADPQRWTRQCAQDFYTHLIGERGLRPQSANRLMASVRFASRWWALRENRPDLDFALIQPAKPANHLDKRALTDVEAQRILATCDHSPLGRRDCALLVLGLETGMRRMSMASARIEGTVLGPSVVRGVTIPYPTISVLVKGHGEERTPIPLSDTATMALGPWRKWLLAHDRSGKGPLFRGMVKGIADDGRNSYSIGTTTISDSGIQKIIHRHAIAAGLQHANPHMFRHTFITWRTAAGLRFHEIAAITGHTLPKLGALADYVDPIAIGEKARLATPSWLTAWVAQWVAHK
jgi:site-specific recombinase XerD